jgi:hypothetical protein
MHYRESVIAAPGAGAWPREIPSVPRSRMPKLGANQFVNKL